MKYHDRKISQTWTHLFKRNFDWILSCLKFSESASLWLTNQLACHWLNSSCHFWGKGLVEHRTRRSTFWTASGTCLRKWRTKRSSTGNLYRSLLDRMSANSIKRNVTDRKHENTKGAGLFLLFKFKDICIIKKLFLKTKFIREL